MKKGKNHLSFFTTKQMSKCTTFNSPPYYYSQELSADVGIVSLLLGLLLCHPMYLSPEGLHHPARRHHHHRPQQPYHSDDLLLKWSSKQNKSWFSTSSAKSSCLIHVPVIRPANYHTFGVILRLFPFLLRSQALITRFFSPFCLLCHFTEIFVFEKGKMGVNLCRNVLSKQ